MLIALQKNARTTPAMRAEIAASTEPASVLAERCDVAEQTVHKWRYRNSVHDRSHTTQHLQTTLTLVQQQCVVHPRRTLLLSLDDLLAVTLELICSEVSCSGLDRCLRRHGLGNLNALRPAVDGSSFKTSKACEPSDLHFDVKYLPHVPD